MRKADVLVQWMDNNGITEDNTKFVVFDDDMREGFQDTSIHNIKDHFILTDARNGLTDEDVKRAKEILAK